jgi:hypothetical protein
MNAQQAAIALQEQEPQQLNPVLRAPSDWIRSVNLFKIVSHVRMGV